MNYNDYLGDYVYPDKKTADGAKTKAPYYRKRKNIYIIYWNRVFVLTAIICLIVIFVVVALWLFSAVTTLKINSGSYYMVSIGSYSSLGDMSEQRQELQSRGGAGYVFNDGNFNLIASIYKSETDASKVAESLVSTYTESQVIEIDLSNIEIAIDSDFAYQSELTTLYSYPLEIFDTVYRLSIERDSDEITDSYVMLYLESIQSNMNQKIEQSSDIQEEYLTHLKAYYSYEKNAINSLISTLSGGNDTEDSIGLICGLKLICCDIICGYYDYLTQ